MNDPATGLCRIVVLISGGGTNLQALIDQKPRDAELVAVISNRPGVRGLERARAAGIPTEVVNHREFSNRASFDASMQEVIDSYQADLVVLAGFMRILTPGFVRHYQGRMLNIHPSLLPRYPGLNTHERALEAGDAEHGATVHFVTEELDGGPPIIQGRVPVLTEDTPETLAARVLEQEHRIYPQAVEWFSSGRLRLEGNRPVVDNIPLDGPLDIDNTSH